MGMPARAVLSTILSGSRPLVKSVQRPRSTPSSSALPRHLSSALKRPRSSAKQSGSVPRTIGGMGAARLAKEGGPLQERAGVLHQDPRIPFQRRQRGRLAPLHGLGKTNGYPSRPLVGLDLQNVPHPFDVPFGAEVPHRQLAQVPRRTGLPVDGTSVDRKGELAFRQDGFLHRGRPAVSRPAGRPNPDNLFPHVSCVLHVPSPGRTTPGVPPYFFEASVVPHASIDASVKKQR